MGAFFGSIHIRTEDAVAVRTALEALATEMEARFLLAPPTRGWTVVFPHQSGQDWKVSAALAGRIQAEMLHCIVHDDDVFAYRLYRNGSLADEYDSNPGYFDAQAPRDQPPRGGNVELLRAWLKKPAQLEELRSTLTVPREPGDFAQFRLERFAKLLGLPNAGSSYEYLQAGDHDGIRGWKKFVHIPDQTERKTARKAAAALLQTRLRRCKSEGVLLLDHVGGRSASGHFAQLLIVAIHPSKPEVIHLGTDTTDPATGRPPWMRSIAPQWKPEPMPRTAGTKAQRALFSPSGRWLAVLSASGRWDAEIWDWPSGTKRAEPTFAGYVSAMAFSPDESQLLAACNNTLHRIPLGAEEPRSTLVLNCRQCQTIALHPDGRWVAVGYDGMLGLLDFTAPDSVLLFGVGGLLNYAPVMARMFDDSAIQKLMEEMARLLPPEELEKHRQELLRQRQQSYQGKEPVTLVQFSPDGRWLLCGTREGVRVFDWARLKTCRQGAPTPDYTAETDEQTEDEDDEIRFRRKYLYAMAFDEPRQRVLFGGLGGNVRYLDLLSGLTGDLLELPDGLSVQQIGLTSDRGALVLTRAPVNLDHKGRARFQIWSYPRLCDAAGIPH